MPRNLPRPYVLAWVLGFRVTFRAFGAWVIPMKTLKHQIRVDGQLINAFYATKATALQRVEIARKAGHDAEYAGAAEVYVPLRT